MSHINDTLKRINELAAKKKSGQELTPEELAEKKELYEIYLSFIRGQITSTLDRVEFVDPETGERTAPKRALEDLAKEADQDIKEHKDKKIILNKYKRKQEKLFKIYNLEIEERYKEILNIILNEKKYFYPKKTVII